MKDAIISEETLSKIDKSKQPELRKLDLYNCLNSKSERNMKECVTKEKFGFISLKLKRVPSHRQFL